MASAPTTHQKEESKLLTLSEGPITSRLRSSSKIRDVQTSHKGEIDVNNQSEDKPSRVSRNQKGKSKNSAAKKSEVHTASTSRTSQPSTDNPNKKNNDSTPKTKSSEIHISSCTRSLPSKDQGETKAKSKVSQPQSETKASSSCRTSQKSKDQELEKIRSSAHKKSNTSEPSSSGLGKEKEKTTPSLKLRIKPIMEHPIYQYPVYQHPVYHIRWKGFEETRIAYNCSLCEKDIADLPNEEKWKNFIHEENELEYSIFSREVMEQGQCSILPGVAILSCSHVFHSTCLSETLMKHNDPPCPICLSP